MIFTSIILLLFCVAFWVLIVVVFSFYKTSIQPINGHNAPTSVIIPFRNEATRIVPLLQTLNTFGTDFNGEFIFINDHSTDNSESVIKKTLQIPYVILNSEKKQGKKQAILQGVQHATYERILTLDADVSFEKEYLNKISHLPPCDLCVLPVKMSASTLLQTLFQLDFNWLQLFTFFRPLQQKSHLANGANLVFSKSTFLTLVEKRNDWEILSGDDYFLHKSMYEHQYSIHYNSSSHLCVSTPAPETIKSFLQQRKRWAKKSMQSSGLSMIGFLLFYFVITYGWLIIIASYEAYVIGLLAFTIQFSGFLFIEWRLHKNHYLMRFLATLCWQLTLPFIVLLALFPLPKEKRWTR